jgi:hypothetical protein
MLRTFAVASLAIALSIGLAQAKGHRQRTPMCGEGQQATATCLCGVALGGQPVLCQKGQWCHWQWRICTP